MQKDLSTTTSSKPPRRGKRSLCVAPNMSSTSQLHPQSMPRIRPCAPKTTTDADVVASSPPPTPAKRGRKPALQSRTAREAQRKLNHSVIEKIRRTKINEAFASLKGLIPSTYGRPEPSSPEDDDDDDDDEAEHQRSPKKAKPKPKTKKDEQEKEFKLEILLRTVAFLQDLLKRVSDLEAAESPVCPNCASNEGPGRRKRMRLEAEVDTDDMEDHRLAARPPKQSRVTAESSTGRLDATNPSSVNSFKNVSKGMSGNGRTEPRLPSISSWLPESLIDPRLLPPPKSTRPSHSSSTYLPSLSSSTPFDPVRSSQLPPVLHLGPGATMPSTLYRATGNENAASLRLQIGAPPAPAQYPHPAWDIDCESSPPSSYSPTSQPPETPTQATNLKRPNPSWG